MVAGFERIYAVFLHALNHIVALGFIRHVKSHHHAAAAYIAYESFRGIGQRIESGQQALTHLRRVIQQLIFVHDLQEARRPHHIGQVAAPGGIDTAFLIEDVVGHIVDARPHDDAADLRLLTEDDDVRLHAHVFDGPHLAGDTHTTLDLIQDE